MNEQSLMVEDGSVSLLYEGGWRGASKDVFRPNRPVMAAISQEELQRLAKLMYRTPPSTIDFETEVVLAFVTYGSVVSRKFIGFQLTHDRRLIPRFGRVPLRPFVNAGEMLDSRLYVVTIPRSRLADVFTMVDPDKNEDALVIDLRKRSAD